MRLFVLKLLAVIGLFLTIDFVVSSLCSSMLKNWPDDGSPLSIDNNCFNKVEPGLLLLGASQVQHDYNSDIFANIVGLDTYNAGQDGIDVIQNYMYFKAICNRKMPRIVVFDIYPAYLDGSMKYRLRNINMWYRLVPSVSEYFDSQSNWQEQLKLKSGMYVYNGFPAHIARSFFRRENSLKGFVPLFGTYSGEFSTEESFAVDSEELEYLDKIVSLCKKGNCRLYFTQAPNYIPNPQYKLWLSEYCEKNKIPLLNHVDDITILNRPDFFVDNAHLNSNGANFYSVLLAKEITEREGR